MEAVGEASDQAAWDSLVEVDRLTVFDIVDNETDGMSTACYACDPSRPGWSGGVSYRSEFTRLTQAFLEGKLQEMDMRRIVHAGHGLSLLLVAECGAVKHTLLLDAGPEPQLWRVNAERLGVKVDEIEAVVLSHWHPDHSGGLPAVAEMASAAHAQQRRQQQEQAPAPAPVEPSAEPGAGDTPEASGVQPAAESSSARPPVVFDVHPDRPLRRGIQLPDGNRVPFNPGASLDELSQPGCRVEQHGAAHTLLDGFFFVSGAIPRLTSYETGLPSHISQRDWAGSQAGLGLPEGEEPPKELWVRDPLIMDERYVAVRIKGRGPVIFSSCSHAGIVNVTRHVASLSLASGGPSQLLGIVGGFHLSGRECEPRVEQTVTDLVPLINQGRGGVVLAGHCTGWRAKAVLAAGLPAEHFQTLVVGGQYSFHGIL